MSEASPEPKVSILLTTSTANRTTGVLRQDSLTGRNYAQAVVAAGALPLLAPTTAPDLAPAYAASADALLLTGGCDIDPQRFGQQPDRDLGVVDVERDAFELALYEAFRTAGKPVLGICRGIQLINVAHGGTLHQHVASLPESIQHDQLDLSGTPQQGVTLTRGSRLAEAYGAETMRVNSYHHQAIDRLGAGLRAVAHTADGLIEAVEGEGEDFLIGVQWHPEMSWRAFPEHHAPFRLLADATFRARDRAARPAGRSEAVAAPRAPAEPARGPS